MTFDVTLPELTTFRTVYVNSLIATYVNFRCRMLGFLAQTLLITKTQRTKTYAHDREQNS
jgi:hypothetical protein